MIINFNKIHYLKNFQRVGYEADNKIPHVPFPSPMSAISMNPDIPQVAPHEFLTKKYGDPASVPYPTAKTPWSKVVPQWKNNPFPV